MDLVVCFRLGHRAVKMVCTCPVNSSFPSQRFLRSVIVVGFRKRFADFGNLLKYRNLKMKNPKALPRDFSSPISPSYNPKEVEQGWNTWWEANGFFTPNSQVAAQAPDSQKFVIVIPPPNVTGSLHLGHTLTNAIQDSLTRWHRMKGDVTLWVPGTDHAGIATQSVVERQLLKVEGVSRHDLGREAFLQRVWEWKEKNGSKISNQLRRLGVSVDWSREAFTLSPQLSKAVTEAFVELFDRGLIYRDTRLVSWCPHLKTALSDIEVDTEDIEKPTRIHVPGYSKSVEVGMLWYFLYRVADLPDEYIEVATTRIETMLGDVAVAVHPSDQRYRHLIGNRLIHPFFPSRDMRVVADEHVDIEFGTGAVKITPAHDKNDYEIGKRHDLPIINVFTLDGHINENGGDFSGMHRFECRVEIEKKLTEMKLMIDKKPNEKKMQLPRCSRSNDIVEYMLIPQWWMDCKGAAKRAVDAVRTGELEIIPSNHEQTWYYWLENIKDWCISRQLWWGHRIPAYRIILSNESEGGPEIWVAARSLEEAKQKAEVKVGCSNFQLIQDEDVLDTWFSSGLFPFSVMGWPEKTADMKGFFPTSLLETGHDILFFWVARMVMMSLLLLEKLPFRKVLLHAMVRDAHGKKMSKSLGNVVDPLDVIEGITLAEMNAKLKDGNLPDKEISRATEVQKKDFPKGIVECGADALRYGLLAYTSQGRSINLDVNRVVGYRFFCNKLWNATKFALMNFPEGFHTRGLYVNSLNLTWSDHWILHRLSECSRMANESFEKFELASAVTSTYNFWLYELCDVYLELLKPRLAKCGNDRTALEVLHVCLERGLRLLHPMMPFVTEELYHRLPLSSTRQESISITAYPQQILAWTNSLLDDQFSLFMGCVRQFRSLFANLEINPKERPAGFIKLTPKNETEKSTLSTFFQARLDEIATLAHIGKLSLVESMPIGTVSDIVSDRLETGLDPKGTVNLVQALSKLEKKLLANQKQINGYIKKMQIPGYEERVPEDVRQINSEKLLQFQTEETAFKRAISNIQAAIQNGTT